MCTSFSTLGPAYVCACLADVEHSTVEWLIHPRRLLPSRRVFESAAPDLPFTNSIVYFDSKSPHVNIVGTGFPEGIGLEDTRYTNKFCFLLCMHAIIGDSLMTPKPHCSCPCCSVIVTWEGGGVRDADEIGLNQRGNVEPRDAIKKAIRRSKSQRAGRAAERNRDQQRARNRMNVAIQTPCQPCAGAACDAVPKPFRSPGTTCTSRELPSHLTWCRSHGAPLGGCRRPSGGLNTRQGRAAVPEGGVGSRPARWSKGQQSLARLPLTAAGPFTWTFTDNPLSIAAQQHAHTPRCPCPDQGLGADSPLMSVRALPGCIAGTCRSVAAWPLFRVTCTKVVLAERRDPSFTTDLTSHLRMVGYTLVVETRGCVQRYDTTKSGKQQLQLLP